MHGNYTKIRTSAVDFPSRQAPKTAVPTCIFGRTHCAELGGEGHCMVVWDRKVTRVDVPLKPYICVRVEDVLRMKVCAKHVTIPLHDVGNVEPQPSSLRGQGREMVRQTSNNSQCVA